VKTTTTLVFSSITGNKMPLDIALTNFWQFTTGNQSYCSCCRKKIFTCQRQN